MDLYVQFEDDSKKNVVAYFMSEQDPVLYKNTDVITSKDKRWVDYYQSQSECAQEVLPKPDLILS